MHKQDIYTAMRDAHNLLIHGAMELSENVFLKSYHDKWNAGQHLEHINLSLEKLTKFTILPKFLFKWRFGKANRPSRSYEQLVEKYLTKLYGGGIAPSPFIPGQIGYHDRIHVCNKITKSLNTLIRHTSSYSEADLDIIILPHPLLGKITMREMLYFMTYHAEHHHQLIYKYM